MRTQSRDTHIDAEAVQVALLKNATTAQRFARLASLSETTIALSRRALRRRNPDWSERELDLAFVALHYGEDLATRLAAYLEARS